MNKYQKICLIITISFSLNYGLSTLLNFHFINDIVANQIGLEKLCAFIIGACGFINILLFKKEE